VVHQLQNYLLQQWCPDKNQTRENKLQKQKIFQYSIPVVVIVTGIFLSSFMSPGISRAGWLNAAVGTLSGSSVPARITPEVREILSKSNLQVARYKTVAPDFELRDLDGKIVRLSQFRGETVLLGFFTTW